MRQRFRRSARLTSAAEFTRCYRLGKRLRTAYFTVHAYHREEGVSRLGLAVGKAVGGAVVRNRVKRRLREIFRLRQAWVPRGYDLFIRAAPASAGVRYDRLEAAFSEAMARLSLVETRNADGSPAARLSPTSLASSAPPGS
jgi:ribonuclease P protein component